MMPTRTCVGSYAGRATPEAAWARVASERVCILGYILPFEYPFPRCADSELARESLVNAHTIAARQCGASHSAPEDTSHDATNHSAGAAHGLAGHCHGGNRERNRPRGRPPLLWAAR